MYWVYVDRVIKTRKVQPKHWKAFDGYINALLFAKINGFKLIAKGK